MKSSLNRINGNYLGNSKLYEDTGIHTSNKNYNRLVGTEWIRPSEWLPFPDLSGITQTIVGLLAVIPGFCSGHTGLTSNSNFAAFNIQGAYQVDWGDGTTSAHSSATVASKQYNYYSLPETNFTSEGYKQVIIRITPQSGNNITAISLNLKPSISGVTFPNGGPINLLELKLKTPNLTSTTALSSTNSVYPLLKNLEFLVDTPGLVASTIPNNLFNLENFGGSHFLQNNNTTNIFNSCYSIKAIPLLYGRNTTSYSQQFQNTYALRYVAPFHSQNVTNFSFMFFNSYSIQSLPFFNTSSGITYNSVFQNAYCLKNIPEINLSAASTVATMYSFCYNLQKLPPLNTSNATNFSSFLYGCYSLREIPAFDTSNALIIQQLLQSCYRLDTVPSFNVPKGITLNSCFAAMKAWKYGTLITGVCGNNFFQIFSAAFPVVAGISSAGGTLAGTTFINTSYSSFYADTLRVGPAYNIGRTISYQNTSLSPTALNEVFTSLATLSGVCATINITNVWGSCGCDRTIATAKGWTVVG